MSKRHALFYALIIVFVLVVCACSKAAIADNGITLTSVTDLDLEPENP